MNTGKKGGVSKGFHCFEVILLNPSCKVKVFFKKTLPFLHNNIRSFGFLVVLGEGRREKENKHPRDETLAVLTHFGRKAQL